MFRILVVENLQKVIARLSFFTQTIWLNQQKGECNSKSFKRLCAVLLEQFKKTLEGRTIWASAARRFLRCTLYAVHSVKVEWTNKANSDIATTAAFCNTKHSNILRYTRVLKLAWLITCRRKLSLCYLWLFFVAVTHPTEIEICHSQCRRQQSTSRRIHSTSC